MSIITELTDDRPNVLDQNENIAQLHPSCSENRDLNHEEGKHTPKQKINIPEDKFIWRSALPVTGLKLKI
jgi:hypothetical protein